MHNVASCFGARSNSVTKTRPFEIIGDDSPAPTGAFQRTFWLGPNSTGGLPSPIPEEFGPQNCGHSAALAKLDRTKVVAGMIQEARFMTIYPGPKARLLLDIRPLCKENVRVPKTIDADHSLGESLG